MAKRNLSTFDVAEMLEVDPGSVANWIDGGKLKAHRTPGGHRRVAVEDLIEFLQAHKMPIPEQLRQDPVCVVVVDAEPDMAKMIGGAIRSDFPAFEVIEAQDGFRAGSIIATMRPEVVVLDLRMPGLDGFDVCKLIKSEEATKHAVVIAMTGFPSADSEQRIKACGAKVCMEKPLDLPLLMTHIRASMGSRR